jgi:asparagine synthase (glutamine-hydrolysing)
VCGIIGQLSRDSAPVDVARASAALTALRHRGPDDEGLVVIETPTGRTTAVRGADTPGAVLSLDAPYAPRGEAGAAEGDLVLGARRLAIQDLSAAGHQPLCNEDATVWVAFNGEIHNFVELRRELESHGHRFRSHTDTEVVVHAYEQWGEECFHRFNGMWAFALWDARRRVLLCCRDRYGIKPLVYADDGRTLSFASEIKGLLALDAVRPEVNEPLAYDYLAHGFVDHTAETFFRGVHMLPPGHLLRASRAKVQTARWYDLAPAEPNAEWVESFRGVFTDATALRLVSDVPVGTCLSGGLDSSAIVCTVAELTASGRASLGGAAVQKTFSARYPDDAVDEGRFIDAVAARSAAERHDVFPSGDTLHEELDRLVWHQEEPFGSTSIYAQWCVYRLARAEGVTVTLDGQGGDEVIGGYPQQLSPFLTQLVRTGRVREWSRESRAAGRDATLAGFATTALRGALWSLPGGVQRKVQSAKAERRYPEWLNGRTETAPRFAAALPSVHPGDKLKAQLLHDLTVRLPALLRYCDRNSMAHSVEARLPFLDHRLVELCFALPPRAFIRDGFTKAVLRDAMRDRVPPEVLARRDKIGFATPESAWLDGELREIASSRSFAGRGYVKPGGIEPLLEAHERGDTAATGALWRCVNLELWLRRFVDATPVPPPQQVAAVHA